MISFLHTGDVHVATFERLMDELAPGTVRQHRVEQGWLDEARDKGMSDALWQAIQTGMAELASGGVGVCTCSSIGAAAEAAYVAGVPGRPHRPGLDGSCHRTWPPAARCHVS
jgi:hypothetical protein